MNPFRIPTKPNAATGREWREWERSAKRDYPIRYFLSEVLNIKVMQIWRRWVKKPWYYVKCALWHRHNVVRCKKLSPTWHDRDHLMLHAAFQCLVDFIEREEPWYFKASDEEIREAWKDFAERGEEEIAAWRELRELYAWWEDYESDDLDQHEFETEQLVRLVKLRGHLWT